MNVGGNVLGAAKYERPNCVRPVVCLKSTIPASAGTGEYDFTLVK